MDEPGSELGASAPRGSHAHDLPSAQTTNGDGKKPKNVPFQPATENLRAVDEITEEVLVEQAEQGSGEAFRILQDRHEKEICRFIARMIGDYEVALELKQETFIKVWQSLPARDHRRPMNFRAWLYRIAYTITVDYIRKYPPVRTSTSIEGKGKEFSKHSSWDQGVENDLCQRESINAALQQVYPQYRRCILMRFVGDYSFQEIAQALGISEVTVRANISRGRQQFLQAYLNEIGDDTAGEERR
jgi:RNA polymerase sigma-70 factor, ECF subfamily